MYSHLNRLIEAILMISHNIPFSIYKLDNQLKLFQICRYWIFSKGLKNEFETAVVNEPSVFEPLKVYCDTMISILSGKAIYFCLPFSWISTP